MKKHGHTGKAHANRTSPTYRSWNAMKSRCYRPSTPSYPTYGGRGIKVCDKWQTFAGFLEDVGERPGNDYTIERVDPNGDYEPGNCRWATHKEQSRNLRWNVWIEYNGERLTMSDWARRLGMSVGAIRRRMNSGHPVEVVLDPRPLVRGLPRGVVVFRKPRSGDLLYRERLA